MGQENEIKINPLPSKTWNWLKLNDVTIRWNMDVSPCRIQETGSQQTEIFGGTFVYPCQRRRTDIGD